MKTIRTPLPKSVSSDFRLFLDSIGLQEVMIGDYNNINEQWYSQKCICYAYSLKTDETVAILTHITLKYGNIQTAFNEYMKSLMTSLTTDTYFNWIP